MKRAVCILLIMVFLLTGCGESSGVRQNDSEVLSSSPAVSIDSDISPSSQEDALDPQQNAERELTQSQKSGIAAAVQEVLRKYQMGEYPLDVIYNSDASRFINAFPTDSSYPETVDWKQFTVTQYYDPKYMYPMSLTLPLDNGYIMDVILTPMETVTENGAYISPARGDTTAEWMVFNAGFLDSRGTVNITEKAIDSGRFENIQYDRISITADVLELQLSEISGIFSGYIRYSCFSEYLTAFLQNENDNSIYLAADFQKEQLYCQKENYSSMEESDNPEDWQLAYECLDILNELSSIGTAS